MKRTLVAIACLSGIMFGILNANAASDSQIKQQIIRESISSYPGNCPCPYNTMRNGRSCGKRSAYSRPGGESPVCYDKDVTEAMIREFKQRTAQR